MTEAHGQPSATPHVAAPELEMSNTSSIPFSAFYESHVSFVCRNAERLLGSKFGSAAADDVTQEVFMVALERAQDFRALSSPRTWLFAILRNVVHTYSRTVQRRRIRDSVDYDGVFNEDTGGTHTSAERSESMRALLAMLDKLDEGKREVFVLSVLEQMTAQEIAESIGAPLTTVQGRLRDARKQLSAMAIEQASTREGSR